MTPTDFARSAVDALGWAASEVTLYPVRASEVAAYTGAGLSGTTAKGVLEARRFVSDEGDVGVATHTVTFRTDVSTAADIVVRRWSLVHQGTTYDIVGMGPIKPGSVDLYLQEYQ